LQKYKASLV